jgi:hypothetical protein
MSKVTTVVTNANATLPTLVTTYEVGIPVNSEVYNDAYVDYLWVVLKQSRDSRTVHLPTSFLLMSVRARIFGKIGDWPVSKVVDVEGPRPPWMERKINNVIELADINQQMIPQDNQI